MAARTMPGGQSFVTASEKDVFERLVRQFDENTLVLANVRLADVDGDHEADLVVLMPESGILVVEVKGSHVWHEAGQWWIRRENGPERIDPVTQATNACYALRRYVEADPRWSRGRLRWDHHVVLARTALPDDFATPDCPRWAISGENDLDELATRLWDTTWRHRTQGGTVPSRDDVDLVAEIVGGRALPARDVVAMAEDREERAQRLTLEQAELLKVTRLLNRVEIRGGAGSGKTVMAMQQARELASGRLTGEPQRVAVVCYSNGLATFLKRELETGSRKRRPAFVGTFEQLGLSWGSGTGSRDDHDFWERRLPAQMAELAAALPDGKKFDAIIVDEAQDFADEWWTPLLRALRDEETGGLFVYADERQRIFPRFGRPPIPLVPLVLDANLRNTQQIAKAFEPLAPRMVLRGATGPEVTFLPCAGDDAISAADDAVEALFAEGWQASDIALITMGRRHPVQVERQESLGQDGYWADFWSGDDIFYGHVLGFKGLERRCVVLCVNDRPGTDRARERLYVGLSRATDRLVVVGDPATVTSLGGAEVAARLGLA